MKRVWLLIVSGVLLFAVPAHGADDDPRSLLKRLLASKDEEARADLVDRIIEAKADPLKVAGWISEGLDYDAKAPRGWRRREIIWPNGSAHPYHLYVPEGYDASRRHLLLVDLHHGVEDPEYPGDAAVARMKARWEALATRHDCLVVLPQGKRGTEWWSSSGRYNVIHAIRAIREDFNVDEDRIFVTGFGDGGTASYLYACLYPTLFAGAVPLNGHLLCAQRGGNQVFLRSFDSVPVYALSGRDSFYDPATMRPLFDLIGRREAPLLWRRVDADLAGPEGLAAEREAIWSWIESARRNPHPKKVVWEGDANTSGRVHWLRATYLGWTGNDGSFPDLNPIQPRLLPDIGMGFDSSRRLPGLQVTYRAADSAVVKMGLAIGDIVLAINGIEMRDVRDYRRAVRDLELGAPLKIRYRRGTETHEVEGKCPAKPRGPILTRSRGYGTLRGDIHGQTIDVAARRVQTFEIYLSHRLLDLEKPIIVRVNGEKIHEGPVEPDLRFLLEQAVRDRDRSTPYLARLYLRVPTKSSPGDAGPEPGAPSSTVLLELRRIMTRLPPGQREAALLAAVERFRSDESVERQNLTPLYEALVEFWRFQKHETFLPVARDLLSKDPDCPGAWRIVDDLSDTLLARLADDEHVNRILQTWIVSFPRFEAVELQRALDLLSARIELAEGKSAIARRRCERILAAAGGSRELRTAARDILLRAGLLPIGLEGPGFRLPGLTGGVEIALGDFRGRVVLLLFDAGDDVAAGLRRICVGVAEKFPSEDCAVVLVPLDKTREIAADENPDWHVVVPGAVNLAVARRFGVGNASALFLLGVDGRVLKNQGWHDTGARADAARCARDSLGPSVNDLLSGLSAEVDPTWMRFRRSWRALAARQRGFGGATAENAEALAGRRGVLALHLAAARIGIPIEGECPVDDMHGELVSAWCEIERGGAADAWTVSTAPLRRSHPDAALAIVDAIFDMGLDGEAVRNTLEEAARRGREWKIVSMALRGLSWQDCDDRPSALRKHSSSKVWQVRMALAEALAGYRDVAAVDALIRLLGDASMRVRVAAAASLSDLTGRDFGVSLKRWTAWRRKQGKRVDLPPRELDVATFEKRQVHRYAQDLYFGLRIASDRVAFVLDKSDSMYYGLYDQVVTETESFLRSAGVTTSFAVVEFDAKPRPWKRELLPATPRNIDRVVSFLRSKKPYGPTNIMDSVETAMNIRGVDTVILLSDGLPNRGRETEPTRIIDSIVAANRYTRTVIHTLWMTEGRRFPHDGPRGADKPPLTAEERRRREVVRQSAPGQSLGRFLMKLAETNEGTFGVSFADSYDPPPGSKFRPTTDD